MFKNINKTRTFVPANDNYSSLYIIIGDQPSRNELIHRKPFLGDTSKLLWDILGQLGIVRSDCLLLNVIMDADKPLKQYINLDKKPRLSEEGVAYINQLRNSLSKLRPKVIFALGEVALYALTELTGITKYRGSPLSLIGTDIPVMPTYHPKHIEQYSDQWQNRFLVFKDFKRGIAIKALQKAANDVELIIRPSKKSAMDFLKYCKSEGLKGERIAHDIETIHYATPDTTISCFSMAVNNVSMCINFMDAQGLSFTKTTETMLLELYQHILEDNCILKVTQGGWYDYFVLWYCYGIIPQGPLWDTMIAQRLNWSGFKRGLDIITSLYTPFQYYKAEGKKFFDTGSDWSNFFTYAAMDSMATLLAMKNMLSDLDALDNKPIFEAQCALIKPLLSAQRSGLNCNIKRMRQLAEYHKEQEQIYLKKLHDFAGIELNPHSNKQLIEFYALKQTKLYKGKTGKGFSFDKTALKRMRRNGTRGIDFIQNCRKHRKIYSNYLKESIVSPNGKIIFTMSPAGTIWARFSSVTSPLGTGMNMQNWPKNLREILIPDTPNHGFISIDFSQAENRIVAYLGKCEEMIAEFERVGGDVHTQSAYILVNNIAPNIVNTVNVKKDVCPLSIVGKSWRDVAKQMNHGFNYGWSVKGFALENDMKETAAKQIQTIYFRHNPGVVNVYQKGVINQLTNGRKLTNLLGRTWYCRKKLETKTFRDGFAFNPQSTVGDKINRDAIIFNYNDYDSRKALQLKLQIHDEVVFQFKIPKDIDEWTSLCHQLKRITDQMETPLQTPEGRSFVIPANVSLSKTLTVKKHGIEFNDHFNEGLNPEHLKQAWELVCQKENVQTI